MRELGDGTARNVRCATDVQRDMLRGGGVKVEFKGALRSEQAPAVEVLAACDISILVAPPAFGKTVAAADLIARRKVNTLILVEKVTLLEQWKERLEQFLEIDESCRSC